jgi:GTP-binding protein EngB required for normal cell division
MLRVALIEKLGTAGRSLEAAAEEPLSMPELTRVSEVAGEGRYNIAVVGRTGVGKSALINYLFGKKVAESGIGRPVTKRGFTRQDFELRGIPGTLFDSWGLEVDNSDEWIADLEEEMRRRGTDRPAEDWFYTIFFCIDACSFRIQHFEISILRRFLDARYRAVVIFTKSDLAAKKKIDVLRNVLDQEIGAEIASVPVCSAPEELATGQTTQFGANEVILEIYNGFWQSIIQDFRPVVSR